MKRLSLILLFAGVISCIQAQNTKWAKAFGAANADVIAGVAEDATGNTYITGWYATSTSIGSNNFTSKGSNDLFLAKLDTGGNVLWAVSEGGTGDDRGYGVTIDGSGNVIVCGQFSVNFTFGNGANSKAVTSAGSTDIFVAGYSASGNFLNIITAGGTNGDRANALAADGNGNFAITGYFGAPAGGGGGGGGGMGGGTATFGSKSINSVGAQDAFVAAMNASNGWIWADGFGSLRGSEVGNDIAIAGGNIYVVGAFRDSTNFGGTVLVSSPFANDAFILKLSTSGTVSAVVQGGSTGVDAGNGITNDPAGNIYVAGSFGTAAGGGGGAGGASSFLISGNTLSGTGSEAFIAAFDGNLGLQWAKSYGSANAEAFSKISFGNGGLIVGGTFATATTIGSVNLTAAGGSDAIAASLDTAGNVYWALAMGGTNAEDCRRVLADPNGRMFFAGSFNGPTGGGGGGTPAAQFGSASLTPSGNTDGYLVQFYTCSGLSQKVAANGPTNFCQSGSVRLSASAGAASYQWYVNGNLISGATFDTITVAAAGTYYCALTNAIGCAMNSANTTINIGTPPSASLSATSTSICQGDSVMLTATAGSGYKYKFYQNNTAISGWINSASFYAKTAGDYKVEIDNYGCTDMSTAITLTVTAAPSLSIQAMGATSFCAGDSVKLKGDTNSTWFYQWQRQVGGTWNMVQNANADSLWAKANGNYRLVITTLNGCNVSSNVITLNVGGTANAALQGFPGSPVHCKGDSVTLGINTGGGGGGGLQYRWMKDGDTIPGVTTRNYVIKATGIYKGVVLNGACKTATRDTSLVFINSNAQITPAPAINLCTNDTIRFRATADAGSTFAWSLNGVAISGATDSILPATAGGDYTCTIALSGCAYTTPATKVTLYPAATPPAIVQNGNTMGCNLTSTSYQWYVNNSPIPGANAQFLYGFSSGFYAVEITDANGCKAKSPLFSFNYTANGVSSLEINKLNLFPNPSSGQFNFFVPGEVRVSIQAFNPEGKQVFSNQFQSVTGNQTLDLSGLENGFYIVRINYNDRIYIDRVQILK